MKRYFTSDWHLGSTNILKYAVRPFKDATEAMHALIDNANKACKKEDVLIHNGDWMLSGADRHGETEDIGLDISQDEQLNKINCNVILIDGNHDSDHNSESACSCMTLNLNHRYKDVTVGHVPSYHNHYLGHYGIYGQNFSENKKAIHIHLCGHVHQHYKYIFDKTRNVLNYNVGVDCHDYAPVKDSKITEDLDFLFKHHLFDESFEMNCAEEAAWKKEIEDRISSARKARKEARYKKKGLTPEECEKRKIEAMRKKGIFT